MTSFLNFYFIIIIIIIIITKDICFLMKDRKNMNSDERKESWGEEGGREELSGAGGRLNAHRNALYDKKQF